jgi:very-short-patch-repair endonuclease
MNTHLTPPDCQSPSPARGRGAGERVLLTHAKAMRSHSTEAEQCLWYHLRAQRFMGLKFKRQKPVGPFIVDFICLELGLIVEAAGGQHGDPSDHRRDAWLRERGYTVLHFWNNDVLRNTESVLERVRQVVLTLSPGPSPASGRGEKEVSRMSRKREKGARE